MPFVLREHVTEAAAAGWSRRQPEDALLCRYALLTVPKFLTQWERAKEWVKGKEAVGAALYALASYTPVRTALWGIALQVTSRT